jgi:hypothetical protein
MAKLQSVVYEVRDYVPVRGAAISGRRLTYADNGKAGLGKAFTAPSVNALVKGLKGMGLKVRKSVFVSKLDNKTVILLVCGRRA